MKEFTITVKQKHLDLAIACKKKGKLLSRSCAIWHAVDEEFQVKDLSVGSTRVNMKTNGSLIHFRVIPDQEAKMKILTICNIEAPNLKSVLPMELTFKKS